MRRVDADGVIDVTTARFEERVKQVDAVVATICDETLTDSFGSSSLALFSSPTSTPMLRLFSQCCDLVREIFASRARFFFPGCPLHKRAISACGGVTLTIAQAHKIRRARSGHSVTSLSHWAKKEGSGYTTEPSGEKCIGMRFHSRFGPRFSSIGQSRKTEADTFLL